jgi:hypothetical protein
MELLGDMGHIEGRIGPFGECHIEGRGSYRNSTQDRCTVGTERTIGSVIFLYALDGTPR